MPRGKRVWVAVELVQWDRSALYRGSMAAGDVAALLRGTFKRPFVSLGDVHWVDAPKGKVQVTAYGRDGAWQWHTGVFHVRPANIISIAELKDGSAATGPR